MEEKVNNSTGQLEYTGKKYKRLILVLDCLVAHEFSNKTIHFMNLQHYVIRVMTIIESLVIRFFISQVVMINLKKNVFN